jgi:hypothetical protein
MKCPVCKQEMKKVRWEITNNGILGKDYKEYGKSTYNCKEDDVWGTTEKPITIKNDSRG